MQLYIVSDKRSHNVLRSIYIFMRICNEYGIAKSEPGKCILVVSQRDSR